MIWINGSGPIDRDPHSRPVNCRLSNLVEMGGLHQHYGRIRDDGTCAACGEPEFAPGFRGPSLLHRIRESKGCRRDALIYIPSGIFGVIAWSLLGWWALPAYAVWTLVFARCLHGEWIWEWWRR